MKAEGPVQKKWAVILGDNFFEDDISSQVEYFKKRDKGCSLFCKKVKDPERYGVAKINQDTDNSEGYSILEIVEKPKSFISRLAVTGLYFYDETVFDKIKTLKPSSRGELEVTDLNMLYVNEGTAKAHLIDGYWNDMGTFDSILDTASFVRNNNFKLDYEIDAWKK